MPEAPAEATEASAPGESFFVPILLVKKPSMFVHRVASVVEDDHPRIEIEIAPSEDVARHVADLQATRGERVIEN